MICKEELKEYLDTIRKEKLGVLDKMGKGQKYFGINEQTIRAQLNLLRRMKEELGLYGV